MAFSVAQMYPGAFDPDAAFVDGKYKNSSAPGVYDGTPLDNLLFNQNLSLFDAMMVNAGLTYNNSADTPETSQLFEAMQLSSLAENRFKGNQNWNVSGSTGDPLPGVTPTLYTVGSEVAAGVEVITTNADQITYVAGVLNSGNNTGILRRRYAKDAAGLITKTSQYGGIKLPDGSQLQALADDIATNGVRIAEDGSDVVVDVDLSVVTTGFRFFGLSDERGAWADINESSSIKEYAPSFLGWNQSWQQAELTDTGAVFDDGTPSYRADNVVYTNPYETPIAVAITSDGNFEIEINGVTVYNCVRQASGEPPIVGCFIVPGLATYEKIGGSTEHWAELR